MKLTQLIKEHYTERKCKILLRKDQFRRLTTRIILEEGQKNKKINSNKSN